MASDIVRTDALRYGLRCLDEMAREQASVAMPSRHPSPVFDPSTTLRPIARDGAALSLRLFSDADDATDFTLRDADECRWDPVPARATSFFEAWASCIANDGEDELVVGFPMVTFTQQGQRRVAPLLSWSGARCVWKIGETPWRLTPGARLGAPLDAPTSLTLVAPAREEGPTHTLHGGLWGALFGLDGPALTAVSALGSKSVGALVRAAMRALTAGVEDLDVTAAVEDGPLLREELLAFTDAVNQRAAGRLSTQCHPHGLAMLLARGDPTSGLRSEIKQLLGEHLTSNGPLHVFLGGSATSPRPATLWTRGASMPTPSQLRAALALEATRDLVALRGPPGCGKTTLLHHVAAQSIVSMALDDVWTKPPGFAPWSLAVTSTNNGAVDNALAPFVAPRDIPVGIRVGNRKTLAEVTSLSLRAAVDGLSMLGPSLADARSRFEALATPVRDRLHRNRERATKQASKVREIERLGEQRSMLAALLGMPRVVIPEGLARGKIQQAREALDAHLRAAEKLIPLHGGADASGRASRKALSKWAEANRRRAPVIEPVLASLSLAVPYRDVTEDEDASAEIERQEAAMAETLEALMAVLREGERADRERQLARIDAELAKLTEAVDHGDALPLDPALVDAALDVRDAWARTHRARLLSLLDAAFAKVTDAPKTERSRPLHESLSMLTGLFPVVGCTLLSMRGLFALTPGVFDRLVIDEAGQCAPIYTVAALYRAKRALIAGDTAQLPPVYTLDDRVDDRLAKGLSEGATTPMRMGASATTSAQAVAEARAKESLALEEHFRSQPEIVALASSWSGYTLDVRTPPRSLSNVSPRLREAVSVYDVAGRGERAFEGVVNVAEVAKVLSLVEAIVRDGVDPEDVAVLTPFVGQCARIERELQRRGMVGERGVLVRTVHRLQGGERRVVVFSVAATERRHLRWLCERPHLLHVATSRAQDHLVVFLDVERARGEVLLAPLVRLARR